MVPSQFIYFVKTTVKTFNLSNSGAWGEKNENNGKRSIRKNEKKAINEENP